MRWKYIWNTINRMWCDINCCLWNASEFESMEWNLYSSTLLALGFNRTVHCAKFTLHCTVYEIKKNQSTKYNSYLLNLHFDNIIFNFPFNEMFCYLHTFHSRNFPFLIHSCAPLLHIFELCVLTDALNNNCDSAVQRLASLSLHYRNCENSRWQW